MRDLPGVHMLVNPAKGGIVEQELSLQRDVGLLQGGWMGWKERGGSPWTPLKYRDDLPGGSQQLLCKAGGKTGQSGVIPAPQGAPVSTRLACGGEPCPGVPALLLCPGSWGGPACPGSVPGAARSCLGHPKCDPNP